MNKHDMTGTELYLKELKREESDSHYFIGALAMLVIVFAVASILFLGV